MIQSIFPWLPVGFSIGEKANIRRVLAIGTQDKNTYQICDATSNAVCLLLNKNGCSSDTVKTAKSFMGKELKEIKFGDKYFLMAIFRREDAPMRIADIPLRNDFLSASQLYDLANALAQINSSWGESLYFPAKRQVLALGEKDPPQERRRLIVRLLTGGVADPTLSPKQIHSINRWIAPSEIRQIYRILGINVDGVVEKKHYPIRSPAEFYLPGQPVLEKYFREQIIDYYYRREAYEKMGVHPERGILLYGKPGTGKTYSVNKLAEFLEWEMIEIGVGEIGSKYIHETSVQIRRKFDEARKKAPAIVFLDELDAMGISREQAAGHSYKMEEINELLKQVEKAGKDGLLVIAATNYLEAIDKALTRKGRFDAIIEVRFPDTKDVEAALAQCLSAYPHAAGLNLLEIAQALTGQPLANVAWLANKAGEIAVKSEKTQIDQECLKDAMLLLPKN